MKRWLALSVLAVLVPAGSAWGVKANPRPVIRYQPDGTQFTARVVGDERMVFQEDLEGHTIVRGQGGWWTFADPSSHGAAALAPSRFRVGIDSPPPGWAKHVRPHINPAAARIPWAQQSDGSVREAFLAWQAAQSSGAGLTKATNPTALTLPVLVILVEFSDWKHTTESGPDAPDYEPIAGRPNTAATWQDLFNDRTVAGGLNHYIWEASYGQFQWDFTVAQNSAPNSDGWYTNPNTMKYWGEDKCTGQPTTDGVNNIKDLTEWAIAAADADVDYAPYDTDGNGQISDAEMMIFVIHAREGQENYGSGCDGSDPDNDHIWSHKWNIDSAVTVDGKTIPLGHVYSINPEFEPGFDYGTNPWTLIDKWFGVGVYAHEGFHTLGAPDLYDYDYDANVAGEWDLMDAGSSNGARSGTHPSHMGTPLKSNIELSASAPTYGWIADSDIKDVHGLGADIYQVDALSGSDKSNVSHRLVCPSDATESYMLENRAPLGYYEPYLPEHGIIVWHRDTGGSRDSWPYAAAVERPGWVNTTAGLNSISAGAAFSLEDAQTELTSTTDPDNALNSGAASGLDEVRCIGAETDPMQYVYGSISGANPGFGGAAVSAGTDNDPFLDNDETATVTVDVFNSSCAGEIAPSMSVALAVAADSDIPASAVSITPSFVLVGDIAAGATVSADFSVTLACDESGYADRTITFEYTINSTLPPPPDPVQGTFVVEADKDYLFYDDAEGSVSGWSSVQPFNPSGCATASGHGAWSLSTDRSHSDTHSYHTPEESPDLCYEEPSEVWVSPNVTIPPGVDVQELRFWQAAEIPCVQYSRGRLWISTDDGGSWTRWNAFYKDGGDLTWGEVKVGLDALAGSSQIKLLFTMYTYACWSGCTATEGWYLDDIALVIDEQDGCAACTDPGKPVINTVGDQDGCALTGVIVDYTDGADADHHELLRDGAIIDTDYGHGEVYQPGDSSSLPYVVRAVNGSCSTDSDPMSGADLTGPGAVSLTTITDADTCAQSGIQVWFTGGSGASHFELWRQGAMVDADYVSGDLYLPPDGATYTYVVRAVAGACTTDSAGADFADASDCTCTASPTFAGLTSVTALSGDVTCGLRLEWSAATSNCGGGVIYNIYRSTSTGFTPDPTPGTGNMIASCITGMSWVDTAVTVDTPYYYVVRAEDATLWGGGPCNAGNEDSNLVEDGGTVSSVTENRDQDGASDPLTASSGSASAAFTPAFSVESATTATVSYSLSHVGGGSSEVLTTADFTAAKFVTTTVDMTPDATTAAGSATSATFTYAVTAWATSVNTATLRCVPTTNTTALNTPSANNTPVNTDVTAFYNANGPGVYQLAIGMGNKATTIVNVSMTVNSGGAGDAVNCVRVELVDPVATATVLKDYGSADANPYDVVSLFTGAGAYEIRVTESCGDTAQISGGIMAVTGTTCAASSVEDVQFLTVRSISGENKLEWQNPSAGAYGSAVIRYRTDGAYPGGPADGSGVTCGGQATALGAYNSCIHDGLTNGVTYSYAAFVDNGSGVYSPGRLVTGRPFDSSGSVKWGYSTGASALAPPGLRPGDIGTGGLFAVSNDRNLHGMNPTASGGDWPQTAPYAWTPMAMNGPAQSRPPVVPTTLIPGASQVVFLGSQDGHVYAVNAETGAQLWQSDDLGAMVQAGVAGMFQSFGGTYDLLLVGTRDGSGANNAIKALDPVDGSVVWSFDNGGGENAIGIISTTATVDYGGNRLYFASRAHATGSADTVWCLSFDGSGASKVWSAAVGDIDGGVMVWDGRVYVGTNAGEVHALDAMTGNELWGGAFATADGPVKGFIWPEFTAVPRGLYFSTTNGVWKITDTGGNADGSGANGWQASLDSPSTPLMSYSAPVVHVGSGDGRLVGLSTNDGSQISSVVLGDGGAAVGGPGYDYLNGLLYVGSEAGIVYAVAP